MKYPSRDVNYYQSLHDNSTAYQSNNWLYEDLGILRRIGGRRIAEFGCGNGAFLSSASPYFERLYGYDWAASLQLRAIREENVFFTQLDLTEHFPEIQVDIAASADFLEHLAISDIEKLLPQLHGCARYNYHKIACYDDGHSHQTIMSPVKWRKLFGTTSPEYSVLYETRRGGKHNKRVCVITNWKPKKPADRISMQLFRVYASFSRKR